MQNFLNSFPLDISLFPLSFLLLNTSTDCLSFRLSCPENSGPNDGCDVDDDDDGKMSDNCSGASLNLINALLHVSALMTTDDDSPKVSEKCHSCRQMPTDNSFFKVDDGLGWFSSVSKLKRHFCAFAAETSEKICQFYFCVV